MDEVSNFVKYITFRNAIIKVLSKKKYFVFEIAKS